MAASSARFVIASLGFDGVSAITNIVFPGITAAANEPEIVGSTNVVSIPKRAHGPCKNDNVAPYKLFWATMCEPFPQNDKMTEAIAPMPEPKANADSAPSSSATAFSN
jgi:hypothetical protein